MPWHPGQQILPLTPVGLRQPPPALSRGQGIVTPALPDPLNDVDTALTEAAPISGSGRIHPVPRRRKDHI